MTYAAAHIVYGIDLTFDEDGPFAGLDEAIIDLEDEGLSECASNGMGETPRWIGAEMGFIEAISNSLKGCRLVPTEEDKAAFEDCRRAALEHIDATSGRRARKLARLLRAAEPGAFLAWASS